MNSIKQIKQWEVLTPNGWSNFEGVKKTTKSLYYTIIFDDDSKISCSENHKIKLNNGEFKYVIELDKYDIIENKKIKEINRINKHVELFDLIGVDKDNEYYTNNIVSHNCAFIRDIKSKFQAAFGTLSLGGDCVLLSTPDIENSWFHNMCEGARKNKNGFKLTELPHHLRPDFNEEWKRNQLKTMTIAEFEQEHNCRFGFLSGSVLNMVRIKDNFEYQVNTTTPVKTDYSNMLHIFELPDSNKKYIIGGDCARGDGSDFSTFQVLEVPTGKQVAEFQGHVQTDIFANILNTIGLMYNKALLCIERENMGWAVLKDLLNIFRYPNIYYSVKGDAFNEYLNPDNIISYNEKREMIEGFNTNNNTRPAILNHLAVSLENRNIEIYSKRLYNELSGWIFKKGRYDHSSHTHDDLIFAYAIGLFVMSHLNEVEHKEDQFQKTAEAVMNINIEAHKDKLVERGLAIDFKSKYKKENLVMIGNEQTDLNDLFGFRKRK